MDRSAFQAVIELLREGVRRDRRKKKEKDISRFGIGVYVTELVLNVGISGKLSSIP